MSEWFIAGVDTGPGLGEYAAGVVAVTTAAAAVVGTQRWRKQRPKGKEVWWQVWRQPDRPLWRRVAAWLTIRR